MISHPISVKKKAKRSNFDTPWKLILDAYFQDFMAYCWPEKYAIIDWERGYKMLDKDLARIEKDAVVGDREVDKLVEIYCKDGEVNYLLLHLEVQRRASTDFTKRMYTYRYKLQDIYDKPIASLAILIDNDMNWRPEVYRQEVWGSWIEMGFPIIKLMDYADKIAELENSNNRFASVILAQLAANQKGTAEAKGTTKLALTKSLYRRGWAGDDIKNLYRFIDWLIRLPEDLAVTYNRAVQVFEEGLKVSYVTTAERIGIQKGESVMLMYLLEQKFKDIPEDYKQKIQTANSKALLKIASRILNSQSLEEVFRA